MSERECSGVKCKNKPVWRLEYLEADMPLFLVEYCEDCYNLFKPIFPNEGWMRIG